MKKLGCVGLIIIIAVVAIIWGIGKYNNLISLREGVNKAWSNVETQYQRRADLIPNLVNTVKGYASHESETLQAVVEARTKATSVNINVENGEELTEEALQKFQSAQGELNSALGRLIAVAENYPDLKADGLFSDLQSQLEGTENRVNNARNEFNEVARAYNTKRLKFPTNIVANIFGFNNYPYFKADEGSSVAPTVDFSK